VLRQYRFIAPLSELYGRRIVYFVCNVLFLILTIICGESINIGMLVAFRFLAGCAGAAPLSIGGGSITDMMVVEQRGVAMAIFAVGPLLGPIIGEFGFIYSSVCS
jgi:MFS family permease